MKEKQTIRYPLEQVYDGNAYPRYAPGHLFEPGSVKALCGRKKEAMSAPVAEKSYDSPVYERTFALEKTCERCVLIAINV